MLMEVMRSLTLVEIYSYTTQARKSRNHFQFERWPIEIAHP